ncbi:MAG: elongator complex protein 3 [Candidatus Promineifilaceae bacterium]
MSDLQLETHRKNAKTFDFVPVVNVDLDDSKWKAKHDSISIEGDETRYLALMTEMLSYNPKRIDKQSGNPNTIPQKHYRAVVGRYAKQGLPWLSKNKLISVYHQLVAKGLLEHNPIDLTRIQKKPTRSQSGVAVVTVLTKPFPCPGKCIFCPTDVRMPKSYLHDEPGAQRAERHNFDPFDQTRSRIEALIGNGHPTDKIELLILGGTWSSYRRDYQEWFIKRCFDAMNAPDDPDSADLPAAQTLNINTRHRNVGLVVETRQDHIDADELRWLRYLGVTKVQVGIQSMDEHVLAINKRGHDPQATRDAFRLLRLGGFKIHGHWMANLLGATLESDLADYRSLWSDPAVRPDELKIYPCMLVPNADLYAYWQRGEYQPYTEEDLTELLVDCMVDTPRYVRLTRVIRDIPTTNVVAGNKKANLRQIASRRMKKRELDCHDIRSREIRRQNVTWDDLELQDIEYDAGSTIEHFLSFETKDNRLAGFLRLSFPKPDQTLPLPELANHAMIREVHVYGPVMQLGAGSTGEAQHMGIGSRLITHAKSMALAAGFSHLAVISAIGTQGYYAKHGFTVNNLYMATALVE